MIKFLSTDGSVIKRRRVSDDRDEPWQDVVRSSGLSNFPCVSLGTFASRNYSTEPVVADTDLVVMNGRVRVQVMSEATCKAVVMSLPPTMSMRLLGRVLMHQMVVSPNEIIRPLYNPRLHRHVDISSDEECGTIEDFFMPLRVRIGLGSALYSSEEDIHENWPYGIDELLPGAVSGSVVITSLAPEVRPYLVHLGERHTPVPVLDASCFARAAKPPLRWRVLNRRAALHE